MSSTLTQHYVRSILRTCPQHLEEDADGMPVSRLRPESERELLAVLTPWLARVSEARDRYEAGDPVLRAYGRGPYGRHRPHRAAIDHVMASTTEREAEALQHLYAGVVAMVVDTAWRFARGAGRLDDFEEILSSCYEAYLYAIAAYDPERGASVSSWIHLAVQRPLYNAVGGEEEVLYYEEIGDLGGSGETYEPVSHDLRLQPDYDAEEPEEVFARIAAELARESEADRALVAALFGDPSSGDPSSGDPS